MVNLLFKRKKKKKSEVAGIVPEAVPSFSPTQAATHQHQNQNTNYSTTSQNQSQSQKKKPFRKLKKLWKRMSPEKSATSRKKSRSAIIPNIIYNKNNNNPGSSSAKNSLTLISPEVGEKATNYYSNNTDGFEVILDGKKLQYEADNFEIAHDLANSQDVADMRNCAAGDTCSPLSDWNTFVSLLVAPNLDDIQSFVFGEGSQYQNYGDYCNSELGSGLGSLGSYSNQSSPVRVSRVTDKPGTGIAIGGSRSTRRRHAESQYKDGLPFDEETDSKSIKWSPSTDDRDRQSRERGEGSGGGNQPETVEIQHFSSVSVANDNTNESDNSPTSSPALVQRPVSSGGPITPPKLTSKDALMNGMMARDSQVPNEELYDTAFTLQFLKEVSKIGIILTYFKVPNDDEQVQIVPYVVSLKIEPGLARGSRLLEPKLIWTSMKEGNEEEEGSFISLLGIDSIHTSLGGSDDDNTPFFTITTEAGDVHAFESPTLAERNYIVHGIKNVVAWLSYHLIIGNMATGTELVSEADEVRGETSGELPSLKTPVQAMNDLSHSFLD